ncbi:MAG: ABC transporter substrate-binding protein [Chloroflexi bacterium]|nr:ABC transporter substrate-binding protein [Chloroflexota bacterium]MCI0576264.1 ABC transporter substrate-binding protein [Chloroflexota bacterium]MCI0644540.1 ABC transporter substrate-binding protein [Chloroflexota bacterium]MCI0728771.1 ABC transporter substrate-binding protein [Chloroflexota bacterium]
MKKRLWILFTLILALSLVACQGAQETAPTDAAPQPTEEEEAPPAEPTEEEAPPAEPTEEEAPAEPTDEPAEPTEEPEAGEPSEMHVAWPYQAPPAGHFNSFVSDAINLGIYFHTMQPPLFFYMWAEDDWMPLAGESWEWVDDTTLRVHLVQGAVWSDGSPFTSQDVVDTFDIARLLSLAVWRFIDGVEAVDESTVDFSLIEPSTVVPRRVLRETNIRPSSTYGEFAQRVRDLVAAGQDSESEEWTALVQEFNAFRPEDMVVLGPYKIDQSSITESQLILNRNETSFMADWVHFDRLVNFNGETPDITPLVLAQEVDYATHGFPPATESQFIADGIRIIRAPLYTGPALYFNMDIHPFELPEFRQAVAYAIDRDENGFISLADSGRRQLLMSGFSDNLAPGWLTEETTAALNHYDFDTAAAEELLTGLGFTRDSDGVWLDDTGARLEFELTAPAEFADWSAAAENVAEQLTEFGIATTFRGVNFQQHPVDVRAGDFQMAIRDWGAGNPHPHFAYDIDFNSYNFTGGTAAATTGPGMNFPLVQETSLGELDLGTLTDQAGQGSDIEQQRELVNQLALAYNELLPQIPLWERYGNNPVPDVRVTGWPDDGDPVYLNGPGADPFTIVLLLSGVLQPAE